MLALALLIVACLLFFLSALPPVPYSNSLLALGLMFFAGASLVGHL